MCAGCILSLVLPAGNSLTLLQSSVSSGQPVEFVADRITRTSDRITQTSDMITQTSDRITQTSDRIIQTSDRTLQTSDRITHMSDGITRTFDGIKQASDGITQTSDRITPMSDGITRTSDGITPMSGWITRPSDGLTGTYDSIRQTSDGFTRTSDGTTHTSGRILRSVCLSHTSNGTTYLADRSRQTLNRTSQALDKTAYTSSHRVSPLHSDPDNLTKVWQAFDAFFQGDENFLQDFRRNSTTARTPKETTGGASQTTKAYLDVGDCPQSAGTVFRGVKGVVVGPSLNSSANFILHRQAYECHWTIAAPMGRYLSAAVHIGDCVFHPGCNSHTMHYMRACIRVLSCSLSV